MKNLCIISCFSLILFSCAEKENPYDASGTFEAVETIVPAEANGIIKELHIEEGQLLEAGQIIGYIDTVQLYLKKKQLEAQIKATGKRMPDIPTQTSAYQQQTAATQVKLDYLLQEQQRIQKLVNADAATPKQLDDINAQVAEVQKQLDVIQKQKAANVSALQTQTSALQGEVLPLGVQVAQIDDQLQKSRIINPVNGTVLVKYAEENEMAAIGKPLYKIAGLKTILLRAYVTAAQFDQLKLGQKVKVMVDDGTEKYKEYEGVVEWINNKAEFTPKTIQTKDERANLVYAIKVKVQNDGFIKIGMYGEVKWQ
ncbi:MAG TPA: HlyD family efflux transporter periplasmic adaptor subunit [Agriterribacter sp.]|nr:HlyD family efflux transporter periplasmic adaptor subunit [Agriterribacter sp.]